MHSHERQHQTLEQKLGFRDEDRKNPLHDQFVLWIAANAEACIRTLHPEVDEGWPQDLVDRVQQRANRLASSLERYAQEWERDKWSADKQRWALENRQQLNTLASIRDHALPPKIMRICGVELEAPVVRGYGYLVGFVDVSIQWAITEIVIPEWEEAEAELRRQRLWIPGECKRYTNIEVKTKLSSFGDLLRQLNLYRTYRPGNYALASPDGRHRDVLSTQGIGFLEVIPEKIP